MELNKLNGKEIPKQEVLKIDTLISFILLYRTHKEEHKISLLKLLNSIIKYFTNNDVKIELLLKIDDDDMEALEYIKTLNYPFPIRIFVFNRWEGRHSMNFTYSFFLTERNPHSKFFSLLNDDMRFARSIKEDLDDVIAENPDPTLGIYTILGNFQSPMTNKKLFKIRDYNIEDWYNSHYICSYPIVPIHLMEIMGNFGFQPSIDGHFALFNLIMYKKYGMNLAKHIIMYNLRKNILRESDYGHDFNQENVLKGQKQIKDGNFLRLMEQQAHNVYLNLHEKGIATKYIIT